MAATAHTLRLQWVRAFSVLETVRSRPSIRISRSTTRPYLRGSAGCRRHSRPVAEDCNEYAVDTGESKELNDEFVRFYCLAEVTQYLTFHQSESRSENRGSTPNHGNLNVANEVRNRPLRLPRVSHNLVSWPRYIFLKWLKKKEKTR